MANRSEQEAQEHADMIKRLAEHFARQGYTEIKADIEGYELPAAAKTPRGEFIPDITCFMPGKFRKFLAVEVETCRSIFDPHTVDEWEALGREARIHAGEFHVAVPRLCGIETGEELVKKRMSQLGYTYRPHRIWSL